MLPRKAGRQQKHYTDWIIQGRVSWLKKLGIKSSTISVLHLDQRMSDLAFAALSGPLVERWRKGSKALAVGSE